MPRHPANKGIIFHWWQMYMSKIPHRAQSYQMQDWTDHKRPHATFFPWRVISHIQIYTSVTGSLIWNKLGTHKRYISIGPVQVVFSQYPHFQNHHRSSTKWRTSSTIWWMGKLSSSITNVCQLEKSSIYLFRNCRTDGRYTKFLSLLANPLCTSATPVQDHQWTEAWPLFLKVQLARLTAPELGEQDTQSIPVTDRYRLEPTSMQMTRKVYSTNKTDLLENQNCVSTSQQNLRGRYLIWIPSKFPYWTQKTARHHNKSLTVVLRKVSKPSKNLQTSKKFKRQIHNQSSDYSTKKLICHPRSATIFLFQYSWSQFDEDQNSKNCHMPSVVSQETVEQILELVDKDRQSRNSEGTAKLISTQDFWSSHVIFAFMT